MNIRFINKIALVTGAGKGIGRATAKALVDCGAETYALSRTQSDLDSLKLENPSIHTVCVDLADWDASRKAVQDIGAINLLVNNAGISIYEPFLEVTQANVDKTLDVNLKAVFNVSQVVAKGMVERGGGGSIVNVTSIAIAVPNLATYCASKGGVDQLTRVMALELGPHQIRVNAVQPTVTETERIMTAFANTGHTIAENFMDWKERNPLRRNAKVKDVVEPVLYLLSDKSDMINGVTLPVDGGYSIC